MKPNDDGNKKKNDSKINIMQAAEEVFAEKGFDGARTWEIAKRAGLNSAMLYYYFGSKEEIFLEIIEKHIKEVEIFIKETFYQEQESILTDRRFDNFFEQMKNYMEKKKNILKIMSLEIMKDPSHYNLFLFKMFQPIYEEIKKLLFENKISKTEENYFFFYMFFIITSPFINFIALDDKWAKYYHLDEKKMSEYFLRSVKSFGKMIESEFSEGEK